MIKYLFLLLPFLTFSQGSFFKYSTFYTSMSMNTSMIEAEDYQAIAKGYQDITQVNPYDYNLTIGIRKIARFDYEYKVKTWYYGTEKAVADNVTIGNSNGWEYLLNYSFIRNRSDKFTEQNFWLRYLGNRCVTKIQYTDNQRVDLRYNSIDSRYRIKKGNFDFTIGANFRMHDPYGINPIEDFWIPGQTSFQQLASDFGYSSQFVNGRWHWYKEGEVIATSNDEFYKHYFGQAIAEFNERELDALGSQNELSVVFGVAYYSYNPKFWLHIWANVMPFHYGLDDYSFEYGDGLDQLDWDSGIILGYRITKHLGVFIEGTHQRYWNKPLYESKFGFNYLVF